MTQLGSVLERTVLKEGQLFLVADRDGDIKSLNSEGQGLYFRDRRHLSLFEMVVNGTRLTLLSSASELNFLSTLQFSNDLLLGADGRVMAEPRTISISRERSVSGSLHERIELLNYNPHPVTLVVRFTCGSDFRDMFDVRDFEVGSEQAHGEVEPIRVEPDGVVLSYHGGGVAARRTHLAFNPAPDHVEIVNGSLRRLSRAKGPPVDHRDEGLVIPPMAAMQFEIDLPPMQPRGIELRVTPKADSDAVASPPERLEAIRESYDDWRSSITRIETDHELFDQLVARAALDLRLLVESFDGDLVPTAGIPWFAVPFGRDSLIASMQTLSLHPDVARGTLRFLARHQGRRVDRQRGEARGKILHEVRPGVTGAVGSSSVFYGSIDSTPLFLVALGEYVGWTGDLHLARELLPNATAALDWIADHVDDNGFLLCNRYPAEGLGDQAWKDSPDALNHVDGRPAEQPVALAEVQAYVFAAHRQMARIFRCLGDLQNERLQRSAAERVRTAFLSKLRIADEHGPYWAMGLDARGERIETITTNPAHALWTGLLQDSDAETTADRLIADDMLSGWGIRTLSRRARTFNPMSYHNGSVWPHDNALIALGMKRAGADATAQAVATQVFEAGLHFPGTRLPELWCGFARDTRHPSAPGQYPVGCSPQAWAAGSIFMLLQALLGLEVDAFTGIVRLRPSLPAWLGRMSYRGLRCAGAQLDFDVVRDGHRVVVDVLEDGGLRVEVRDARALR